MSVRGMMGDEGRFTCKHNARDIRNYEKKLNVKFFSCIYVFFGEVHDFPI